MKTPTPNDAKLIEMIQSGGQIREQAIAHIYQNSELKRKIIQFITNHNGNAQDGEDIFHEGIIVVDKNIRQQKFLQESSIEGYLYSICRFLWMNQMRKSGRVSLTSENMVFEKIDAVIDPEDLMENEEKKILLRQALATIGEQCRKLLELWQLSYSMEEIATTLGISDVDNVRKNRYRCHQKLVTSIKSNPALENALRE